MNRVGMNLEGEANGDHQCGLEVGNGQRQAARLSKRVNKGGWSGNGGWLQGGLQSSLVDSSSWLIREGLSRSKSG